MVTDVFDSFKVTNKWFAILDTTETIAGALGGYTDIEFTWLNLNGASIVGLVFVNEKYMNYFTDSEWGFIIAHECSHIFKNHVLGSAFWKIAEKVLKGPEDENKALVGCIKLLLAVLSPERLPPDAIALKNQEYEADERAVQYTRDLDSAINCLRKLGTGNLGAPSHLWDLVDVKLPAMTIGERIDELTRRTAMNQRHSNHNPK